MELSLSQQDAPDNFNYKMTNYIRSLTNLIPQKPTENIERLIRHFLPAAELSTNGGDKDSTIIFHNQSYVLKVILLMEGTIEVRRSRDKLLAATIEAPAIIGLQGSVFRYETHNFINKDNNVVYSLSLEKVLNLVTKHDLLGDMISYISYISDCQVYRDLILINNSSYEVVCMFLNEIENSTTICKSEINVANYILERSQLARSGIMKILSALSYGGHIKLKKGRLVELSTKLPDRY